MRSWLSERNTSQLIRPGSLSGAFGHDGAGWARPDTKLDYIPDLARDKAFEWIDTATWIVLKLPEEAFCKQAASLVDNWDLIGKTVWVI